MVDITNTLRTLIGQGVAMGYGDEIESYLTGKNVDEIRQELAGYRERNPYVATGLEVAGGIAPALVPGLNLVRAAKAGSSLGNLALSGLKQGAVYGSIDGFGRGTGGVANRLADAGRGGAMGGAFGAAAGPAIHGSNALIEVARRNGPVAANKLSELARRFATDESGSLNIHGKSLDMSEAARMQRARDLGYSDQRFYRGEATGAQKNEYPSGAFFSRDKSYSDGFAKRGGADEATEYVLNLQKTFSDAAPVDAQTYSRLVQSALDRDPKLAADMVDLIAPGKTPEWFVEFARRRPDMTVSENGALIRQSIENSSDPIGVFTGAGFDALDVGRDIRKLSGTGIRRKDAAFDPDKANLRNVMAAGAGVATLPAIIPGEYSTGGGF